MGAMQVRLTPASHLRRILSDASSPCRHPCRGVRGAARGSDGLRVRVHRALVFVVAKGGIRIALWLLVLCVVTFPGAEVRTTPRQPHPPAAV